MRHIAEVIWKILHTSQLIITSQERGSLTTPQALKRRIQRLTKELRAAGYTVEIKPPVLGAPA